MEDFDGVLDCQLFVWVKTLSGFTPQRWTQIDFTMPDWKQRPVVAWTPLTKVEMESSLDALSDTYPMEKCLYQGYPDRKRFVDLGFLT
jgi:hypothetical protein